jgi:putative peptidoglycan lipid II flippase
MATDAFFVAFKLPNLLRRMFAEGAFSQAFVPIFGEYKNRKGTRRNQAAGGSCGNAAGDHSVYRHTHRHHRRAHSCLYQRARLCERTGKIRAHGATTAHHFPLYFLYLAGRGGGEHTQYLQQILGAGLRAHSAQSLFYCGGAMVGPVLQSPHPGDGLGCFIAGIVQLAFQIPFLKKIGMLPKWRLNLNDAGVWRSHQTNGAGHVWRFHRADQPYHQHHHRLVSGGGQRFLAVLRG